MFDGKKGCLHFKLTCTHSIQFTLYSWLNQEPMTQEYGLMVHFKEVYKVLLLEFFSNLTPCDTTIQHKKIIRYINLSSFEFSK